MGVLARIKKPSDYVSFKMERMTIVRKNHIEFTPVSTIGQGDIVAGVGVYSVLSPDQSYLAIYPSDSEGTYGAHEVPLSKEQAYQSLNDCLDIAEAMKVDLDPFQEVWAYDMPALARQVADSRHRIKVPIEFHVLDLNKFPCLIAARKRGYTDDQLYLILRLATIWREQEGWVAPHHGRTDLHTEPKRIPIGRLSASYRASVWVVEVRLFDPENCEHLEAVRELCHQHKRFSTAWNGYDSCWYCLRDVVPRLKAIAAFEEDDSFRKLRRNERVADRVEEANLQNRLTEAGFNASAHPVLIQLLNLLMETYQLSPQSFERGDSYLARGYLYRYDRQGSLTPEEQMAALEMCHKYPTLLARHSLSELELKDYLTICGHTLHHAHVCLADDGQGSFLTISLISNNQALDSALKPLAFKHQCPGLERYDEPLRQWRMSLLGLEEVLRLPYDFILSDEIKAITSLSEDIKVFNPLKSLAHENRERTERVWSAKIDDNEKLIVMYSPKDKAIMDRLKNYSFVRASWLAATPTIYYALEKALPLVEEFGTEFEFDPEILRLAKQQESDRRAEVQASHAKAQSLAKALIRGVPVPKGVKLHQFQVYALEQLFETLFVRSDTIYPYIGAIMTQNIGSASDLTVAHALASYQLCFEQCGIIIIAPLHRQERWEAIIAKFGLKNVGCYSYRGRPKSSNYERFALVIDCDYGLAKIADTQMETMIKLSQRANCEVCIPILGQDIDMLSPLQVLDLLTLVRHKLSQEPASFKNRFCEAQISAQLEWSHTGDKNRSELLFDTMNVCIAGDRFNYSGLPPRGRILVPVNVGVKALNAYRIKFSALSDSYALRIAENPDDLSEQAGEVELLRRMGATAKIEYAIAFCSALLLQGERVIVCTAYDAVAEAVAKGLGAHTMTLNTPKADRLKLEKALNHNDIHGLCCTHGAMEVGTPLRATATVLIDRPLGPGAIERVEQRSQVLVNPPSDLSCWLTLGPFDRIMDAYLLGIEPDQVINPYPASDTVEPPASEVWQPYHAEVFQVASRGAE